MTHPFARTFALENEDRAEFGEPLRTCECGEQLRGVEIVCESCDVEVTVSA